ncbi:hypothetical protein V8F33_009670 [Rhypophila sp. PSN 637]
MQTSKWSTASQHDPSHYRLYPQPALPPLPAGAAHSFWAIMTKILCFLGLVDAVSIKV